MTDSASFRDSPLAAALMAVLTELVMLVLTDAMAVAAAVRVALSMVTPAPDAAACKVALSASGLSRSRPPEELACSTKDSATEATMSEREKLASND